MDEVKPKDAAFSHFARVGAALGNARRVAIIDVLAEGERSVEHLAKAVGTSVGNTSRNLQVLAGAGLVSKRQEGTSRIYRLADPSVLALYRELVAVGQLRIAEVDAFAKSFFADVDGVAPMGMADLQRTANEGGDFTLLDVRSAAEYEAGHVPGAINIPLEELAEKVAELPKDSPIVAYCRGPYCVMAATAVQQLREAGFPAARLDIDYPDWLHLRAGGERSQ